MIDVFFCTKAESEIRKALGLACLARWCQEPGINLRILMPDELVQPDAPENVDAIGSLAEFDTVKYPWAEYHAQSDIYVVADDDWLPVPVAFVEEVVNKINRYNAYSETRRFKGVEFCQKGGAMTYPGTRHAVHVGRDYQ